MCSADLANDIYNRYLSSKGRLRLPKNQLTGEPLFFSEVTVTGITNSRDAAYINSWVSSLRGLKKIRMSFHNHISYFIDDHGHYLPGIWKTMIPISKTTNRISTLKLNNVDIKGLAGSLAVELVTTLKLHRCTGLDEFFSAWMLRNPRISLKKLWLYIDGKISRDDALSTSQQIDLFISSSLGLRELVLCSNVHKKYPLWVAARHQKTLQYLLLEVLHAKGTTRCMTQDEIQRLSNDLDGYPEIGRAHV